MKNKISVAFLTIIIVVSIMGISTIMSSSSIKIETFNAIINLDANGDMHIEETWVVDYPEGKSVAFRDIGYQKFNPDPDNPIYQDRSNTAGFKEDSVAVSVFGASGQPLGNNEYRVGYSYKDENDELGQPIQCEPNRSNCESIFIQVYNGMQSQMTFKYSYTISGAVTVYSDTSELNWRMLEYFESGINSSTITVNLPNIKNEDINAWGHGLSRGVYELFDNKVVYEMEKIKRGEFIEFRILMPKDSFSVPQKNQINRPMREEIIKYEQDLADYTNKRITIAEYVFYGSFAIIALMLLVIYRVYKKYDKEYEPNFKGKYYRELPAEYSPAEMSYLFYFRKINDEDVTATLLDLVRRKYLLLDTNNAGINDKNPNFKITLNQEQNYNQLLPHERHIIDWFIKQIGNNDEVSLKEIEDYPKKSYRNATNFNSQAKLFLKKAKEAGKKHDFFESKLNEKKSGASIYGLIPLSYLIVSFFTSSKYQISNTIPIIISLVTTIVFYVYLASIDKRSINGNEDYTKWKAFKDFMLEFGNLKDYPMPGVVVWEHYLVYATSLKIADKVMQQLEVRLPVEELNTSKSTYMGFGHGYYGFHMGYTLGRINRSMTTARSNVNATISAHTANRVGGIGRGGGFSGGSSFGGGGGGFRSR